MGGEVDGANWSSGAGGRNSGGAVPPGASPLGGGGRLCRGRITIALAVGTGGGAPLDDADAEVAEADGGGRDMSGSRMTDTGPDTQAVPTRHGGMGWMTACLTGRGVPPGAGELEEAAEAPDE